MFGGSKAVSSLKPFVKVSQETKIEPGTMFVACNSRVCVPLCTLVCTSGTCSWHCMATYSGSKHAGKLLPFIPATAFPAFYACRDCQTCALCQCQCVGLSLLAVTLAAFVEGQGREPLLLYNAYVCQSAGGGCRAKGKTVALAPEIAQVLPCLLPTSVLPPALCSTVPHP